MSDEPEPKPPSSEGFFVKGPGKLGLAGLSLNDFILLNEEIAGMARAGLPLDKGLAALAAEMGRGKLQRVTATIAADLQAGFTLPQALERQADSIPGYYARLMAASIRTGRVTEVLGTLTVYARTIADLRSVVTLALIYPAVILTLSMTLLVCLCLFVIPLFEKTFADFRMKLPFFTEIVIFLSRHWFAFFLAPALVVLAGLAAARWFVLRSIQGQERWARLLYKVPLMGTMVRSARLAAFTDLLGILVDNGVPLPEALRLAAAASSDPCTAAGAEQVEADLAAGRPLGEALSRTSLVPELVSWMIGLGEKRGTLGTTLHQVANLYRRQVEMRAALLRTLLPPILIILTAGFVVSLFVVALLLPMAGLLEGLGGGLK